MRFSSKLAAIFVTSGLLVAGFAGTAFADTSGGSTAASVGVDPGITMTGLTTSFSLSGSPGATVDTTAGEVTYNVETNNVAGYVVTVQSATANLIGTGVMVGGVPNANVIPIAALTARDGGTANTFAALSNSTPTPVHTQAIRSANGGDPLSTDYQIRIPTVNADTYSATLNYVATTL